MCGMARIRRSRGAYGTRGPVFSQVAKTRGVERHLPFVDALVEDRLLEPDGAGRMTLSDAGCLAFDLVATRVMETIARP